MIQPAACAHPNARPFMPVVTSLLTSCSQAATAPSELLFDWLALPFDTARAQYGRAVQTGLVERSILASRDFECAIDSLERLTLGPLARRV